VLVSILFYICFASVLMFSDLQTFTIIW